MKKIIYTIISKNRAEKCFNRTYKLIKHLKPVIIIEPQDEVNYLQFFNKKELIILPENDKGVTWVRKWCLDNFECDVLWTFDDNIKALFLRSGKTGEGNHKLIHTILDLTRANDLLLNNGYTQGSISFKPSNWYYESDLKVNTRVWGITGFNMESIKKNNINYDLKVLLFSDYDISAQILSKGLTNFVDYNYAFDKTMCEDKNGVGIIRTLDLSKKMCDLLKNKWSTKSKLSSRDIYEPQFKWKNIIKSNDKK